MSEVAQGNWDFYPCRVDDAPASIFLDLDLLDQIAQRSEDTLYVLEIALKLPADHGMGDATEAETLFPVEDGIAEDVRALGLVHMGRLRNQGRWQLSFMGPPGREPAFHAAAAKRVDPSGRTFRAMAKPDADWSYYRTFLYPDDARLRWIQDRRVVDVLERNGDRLELARRVDHWVYFETVTSRDAFIREVGLLGFEVLTPDGDEELGVQLHRVDLVTVEAIHAVTTTLTEIAAKHRGTYDGWETSVEAAESEA